MVRFGVSAFLKMACLNSRPQRTLLKKRVAAKGGGGYDFHRSLRLRAHRFMVDGEALDAVIASTNEIKKEPERNSAKSGLEHLGQWRLNNPGKIIAYQPAIYKSPSGLFQITFTADLGLRLRDSGTAIHIWNTKNPNLDRRLVLATLSLFKESYAAQEMRPDDLGVLSLRDGTLYTLNEASDHSGLGTALVALIEGTIRDLRKDMGLPPAERDDRPPPPPPPGP